MILITVRLQGDLIIKVINVGYKVILIRLQGDLNDGYKVILMTVTRWS